MSEVNTKKIGIWGPSKSGKTTYLAAVISHLKSNYDDWYIFPLGSRKHLSRIDSKIIPDLIEGKFPVGTDYLEIEEIDPYAYYVEQKNGLFGTKKFDLEIVDIPGRWVGSESRSSDQLFAHLATECSGIIAFIDPHLQNGGEDIFGAPNKSYNHAISELIVGLRNYKPDDQELPYIAFCISKCDLDENYTHIGDPEGYLKNILGSEIWGDIRNTFPRRHKVFCVSSIGRYETPTGHSKPNLVSDTSSAGYRIPFPEKRMPINLLDPLLWLFKRA